MRYPRQITTLWNPGYNVNGVINNANTELNNSSTFKSIREDIQLLEKNNDKEYSFNLEKFRAEQKELRATAKQLDDLTKLAVQLNVSNATEDEVKLQADKVNEQAINKNKAWLKRISDDIYVDETVKVVDQMIGLAALAKSK